MQLTNINQNLKVKKKLILSEIVRMSGSEKMCKLMNKKKLRKKQKSKKEGISLHLRM